MKTRQIIFLLLPAIIIACFALFLRFIQYEPLLPDLAELKNQSAEEPQIPLFPDDPILGNKKAPVALVAFEDLACEACSEQDMIFEALLEKYPNKIKIIWKGLPITTLPYPSTLAHQYAYCANKQGEFAKFKTLAFSNQDNLSPEILSIIAEKSGLDVAKLKKCLAGDEVNLYLNTNKQLAQVLSIQFVPTIFLDGRQVQHPQTMEGWEMLLQL